MRTLVFLAIIGLCLAGLRVNKSAPKTHNSVKTTIESAVETGAKVIDSLLKDEDTNTELCFLPPESDNENSDGDAPIAFVDVIGLVNDGIKTVEDATQKKKNVDNLINDGINIIGDVLSNNEDELCYLPPQSDDEDSGDNDEEASGSSFGGLIAFVNVDGLVNDGIKTVEDATQKKKNVGTLINDGINIIGDVLSNNEDELCYLPPGSDDEDSGDNDEEVGGSSFGGLIALVDVSGLVNDGIKTVEDATQKKKNVANLINDGINIIGDVLSNNEDELCYLPPQSDDEGSDADAPIAFVDVSGLVNDGIKTVEDATQKKKNVGQLIIDGLHIIGDLTSGTANTEESFF